MYNKIILFTNRKKKKPPTVTKVTLACVSPAYCKDAFFIHNCTWTQLSPALSQRQILPYITNSSNMTYLRYIVITIKLVRVSRESTVLVNMYGKLI